MKQHLTLRNRLAAAIILLGLSVACGGGDKPTSEESLSVSIEATSVTGSLPFDVSFTAVVETGAAGAFTWNFGDGSAAETGRTIAHTFETSGTFVVTLTAGSATGDVANATITITVSESEELSIEEVIASTILGVVPLEVDFSSTVVGGLPPYSYSWDFGDTGLSLDEEPSHTYSEIGEFEVLLTVTDRADSTTDATITVTVVGENAAPTAEDQDESTDEDTELEFSLDAEDEDGDELEVTYLDEPEHGTLSGEGLDLVYTPDDDFFGTDSFVYTVSDGIDESGASSVDITVEAVNDAPVSESQELEANAGGTLAIVLTGEDVDNDAEDLEFTIIGSPTGTLSGEAPTLLYRPVRSGVDGFSYRVSDGELDSEVATITIDVTGEAGPPVANAMSLETDEDVRLPITLDASDPIDAALTFSVGIPSSGELIDLDEDEGTVTFVPAENLSGEVTFTFTAENSVGEDTARVTIDVSAVNDIPVAEDVSFDGTEDIAVPIVLEGRDVETPTRSLVYELSGVDSQGRVDGTLPNGTFVPTENLNGRVVFEYTVTDLDSGESEPGEVEINLAAVNDRPTADDQLELTTGEEAPITITLTGDDVESPVTFTVTSFPENAQGVFDRSDLTRTDNPEIVFTPADGYNGFVSFTFQTFDGTLDSEPATVRIDVTEVNDPPVAEDDSYQIQEGGSIAISDLREGVLDNDRDPEGTELSAELAVDASTVTGTLVFRSNGTFDYDPPDSDYNGTVEFTYYARDEGGEQSTEPATVQIEIRAVNDKPVATGPASVTTAEEEAKAIDLVASDVETSELVYYVIGNTLPEHGILTGLAEEPVTIESFSAFRVLSEGAVSYTPDDDFPDNNDGAGEDGFSFFAYDGERLSSPFPVEISVTPVNDPPVGDALSFVIARNTSKEFDLTGSDPEGEGIEFTVPTPPSGVTCTNEHCSYSGSATAIEFEFVFSVTDARDLDSVENGSVTIRVRDNNDAPTADDDSVSTVEDEPLEIILTGSDANSDPISFELVEGILPEIAGTLGDFERIDDESARVWFTPSDDYFNGEENLATFTFKANDSIEDSEPATVSIRITPENDRPVLERTRDIEATEGVRTQFGLTAVSTSDVDHDPDELIYTLNEIPTYGDLFVGTSDTPLSMDGDHSFTQADLNANALWYDHGDDEPVDDAASDSAAFSVTDGESTPISGSLSFVITPVNDVPYVVFNERLGVDENETVEILTEDLSFDDEETDAADVRYRIVGGLGVDAPGYLRLDEVELFNIDEDDESFSFSQGDIDRGGLRYVHRGGNSEADHYINFAVADDGKNTGNPRFLRHQQFIVEITTINDPPVSVNHTEIDAEESAPGKGLPEGVVITPTNLRYTDDEGDTITYSVEIPEGMPGALYLCPAEGCSTDTIPLGSEAGSSFTQGDVNSGLVKYIASTDEPGTDPIVIPFSVSDGHNTVPPEGSLNLVINVEGINDEPTAYPDTLDSSPEDQPRVLFGSALTDNDDDPDGDQLTVVDVECGTNCAEVTLSEGSITVTPDPNFVGEVSFDYLAEDPDGEQDSATATFSTTAVPDAPEFIRPFELGTAGRNADYCVAIQATDADPDEVAGLEFVLLAIVDEEHVSPPDWMNLTADPPDGDLPDACQVGDTETINTYYLWGTPDTDDVGSTDLRFVVADGTGRGDQELATLTVSENNTAPVANAQSVETVEDVEGGLAITLTSSDADGDGRTYFIPDDGHPSHGTVEPISAATGPDWVYAPTANYHGDDSFQFYVYDGIASSDNATVTISVSPVNDEPRIVTSIDEALVDVTNSSIDVQVDEDNDANVTISVSDEETTAGALVSGVSVLTDTDLVTSEAISIVKTEGSWAITITPKENGFTGEDPVVIRVTVQDSGDPAGTPDNIITSYVDINLTVKSVNDEPVADPDSRETPFNTPFFIPVSGLLSNDEDIEDGTPNLSDWDPLELEADLSLVDTDDGPAFYYVPAFGTIGERTFQYTVIDSGGLSDTTTVTITVGEPGADPNDFVDDIYCAWMLGDCDAVWPNEGEEICFTANYLVTGDMSETWKVGTTTLEGNCYTIPADTYQMDVVLAVTATGVPGTDNELEGYQAEPYWARSNANLSEVLGLSNFVLADGGWAGAPPDTVDAYTGAIEMGAMALRIPVRLSEDNILYASETDGVQAGVCGDEGLIISTRNSEDLDKCELGSDFDLAYSGADLARVSGTAEVPGILDTLKEQMGADFSDLVVVFSLGGSEDAQKKQYEVLAVRLQAYTDLTNIGVMSENLTVLQDIQGFGQPHEFVQSATESYSVADLIQGIQLGLHGVLVGATISGDAVQVIRRSGFAVLGTGEASAALAETEIYDLATLNSEGWTINAVLTDRVFTAMTLLNSQASRATSNYFMAGDSGLVARGNLDNSGIDDIALCGTTASKTELVILWDGGPNVGGVAQRFILGTEENPYPYACQALEIGHFVNSGSTYQDLAISGYSTSAGHAGWVAVFELKDGKPGTSQETATLPDPSRLFCGESALPCVDGDVIIEEAFLGDVTDFGHSLTVANLDTDGVPELIIGAPSTTFPRVSNTGSVYVVDSVSGGLEPDKIIMVTMTSWQAFKGDYLGHGSCNLKTPDNAREFGYSTTRGDFDGGGSNFLTVGIPGFIDGGITDAGAISFFALDSESPTTKAPTCMMFLAQGSFEPYTDVFGHATEAGGWDPEADARLGHELVAGNLACYATESSGDCSSNDTLAIGLPYVDLDDEGGITDAGAVLLLPSEISKGPSLLRLVTLREGLEGGHLGKALDGDMFGEVLHIVQTNIGAYNNTYRELFIGYPHDDDDTRVDVGAVAVYAGSRAVGRGDLRFLRPGRTGNPLSAEAGTEFGAAFAIGQWIDIGDEYKDWVFSGTSSTPQLVWEAH